MMTTSWKDMTKTWFMSIGTQLKLQKKNLSLLIGFDIMKEAEV